MLSTRRFLLTTTLVMALAVSLGPQFARNARAACSIGDRVDGSTVDQARKRMEAAGFHEIRDLRKGCDNYWHGLAMQGGAQINVALSPQGQVIREGD